MTTVTMRHMLLLLHVHTTQRPMGHSRGPPPSSTEASSIAALTRLFEEQQRQAQLDREQARLDREQAQLDREENREIFREPRRQQQVLTDKCKDIEALEGGE